MGSDVVLAVFDPAFFLSMFRWDRPLRNLRKDSRKDFLNDFLLDIGLSSAFAISAKKQIITHVK